MENNKFDVERAAKAAAAAWAVDDNYVVAADNSRSYIFESPTIAAQAAIALNAGEEPADVCHVYDGMCVRV